jgi:ATP-dependent Clp protease protease subunit
VFKVDEEKREIYIYDDIGPNWLGMIDSGAVVDALEQLTPSDRVTVRINSPGGDVVEELAIFNALKRFTGGVDTYADGLAASCGSYIFAAGENRIVAENAMLMIHDPWGMSIGNAEEHRKTADVYDKFADAMARDYAESASKDEDELREMMRSEVWLNASEAVEQGFATAIGEASDNDPIVAQGRFEQAPAAVVASKRKQPGTRSSVGSIRKKSLQLLDQSRLYRSM